jgi:hypothetical protein
MSILKLLADQLDILPGFDPDKNSRGMLSQLLGMNKPQTNPSGVPPIMPQDQMSAPGGANPFQQFAKPRGAFARMLTPNSYDRQYDAGHQNFLAEQGKRFDAQQAQAASQRQAQQRQSQGQAAGLQGRELLDFVTSGEVPTIQTITKGDSYLNGNRVVQAPMPFEARDDAFGRGQSFDPNTGEFGAPQGPAKPISLASGAQAINPITSEVVAHNTGMTDYQRGQLENERAELEAEAAKASGPNFDDESKLRKEYYGQNKGFQEVQRSYDRIVSTDPTNAAGQMSLIFQYMKMMDPGSTVREGEFANAQNTTGIPGQVLNAYNRAARGEYLNPQQVTEFQNQAEALYSTAANEFERSFQTYRATADEYEFNPERTIPDLRNPAYGASPMGGPDIPEGAVQMLRQNATPEMRAAFDEKYGAGAAASVLGQ